MRCTGTCSASVGSNRKMAPAASTISATAAAAAFSYLFIEHKPCGERGEHHEQYVEVYEQGQGLVVGPARAHRDLHGLAPRDDERNPQRQGEQRKQELASTDARHHRCEQAAH